MHGQKSRAQVSLRASRQETPPATGSGAKYRLAVGESDHSATEVYTKGVLDYHYPFHLPQDVLIYQYAVVLFDAAIVLLYLYVRACM